MNEVPEVLLVCNLKEILQKKRISANFLANTIEERRSTINNLINNNDMGKRQIPARLIAKLCYFLNVTPSDLFEIHKVVTTSFVAEKLEDYKH